MFRSAIVCLSALLFLMSALFVEPSQAQGPAQKKGKGGGSLETLRQNLQGQFDGRRGQSDAGSQPRDRGDRPSDRGSFPGRSSERDRGDRDDQRDRSRGDSSRRFGLQFGSDTDRRDSRSRLGITIGPGGLQIYRGPDGGRPRPGFPYPYYHGRDPWYRGPGRNWPGYYGRGWGIIIQTRPQVPGRVEQVFVPQTTDEPDIPPVPTADEAAAMPGVEVRGLLLFAVERFDDELNGISTGASWRSYLQIADLRRLVPAPDTEPPAPGSELPDDRSLSASEQRELAAILKSFDQTAENPTYEQISGMWGFRTIQVTLRELLIPPVQRLHRQLGIAADVLTEELQQFQTGSSWVTHLNLAEMKRLATIRSEEFSDADRLELQNLIVTFDRVVVDSNYRMISDLASFRMALHVMRAYQTQLEPLAPPADLPAPPAPEK